MSRSRIALTGAAALAAAALVLTPAAAHAAEGDLYVWVYNPIGSDVSGFGTINPADAALTFLGTDSVDDLGNVVGLEVCNNVGYALDNAGIEVAPVVATWDPATGAVLSGPVELTVAGGLVLDIREADTLADCTLLTIAQLNIADDTDWYVVSVNAATGAVEPLVLIEYADPMRDLTGLATTAAGVTYLFADLSTNDAAAAIVDLDAGTHTAFQVMEGYFDAFGDNFTHGIDFDSNDVLWSIVGVYEDEQYHLSSLAAGSDILTGVPADHGLIDDNSNAPGFRVNYPAPLAADGGIVLPAPGPQLAATGAELPAGVVLAAGILLLAGAALVIARRRAA